MIDSYYNGNITKALADKNIFDLYLEFKEFILNSIYNTPKIKETWLSNGLDSDQLIDVVLLEHFIIAFCSMYPHLFPSTDSLASAIFDLVDQNESYGLEMWQITLFYKRYFNGEATIIPD